MLIFIEKKSITILNNTPDTKQTWFRNTLKAISATLLKLDNSQKSLSFSRETKQSQRDRLLMPERGQQNQGVQGLVFQRRSEIRT